ncbi:DUF2169 domain-containing protein [Polyangium jinanense]|uniref:DUF2169 family type VI secretion system accessory protein n=1 Tax=Polyangium jinanense TaxID=2829994 RepID=UPI0023403E75|nr:DUF2169 domain-containing protein [Polyangium jinanense]MDC3956944.1 DUF2169 domain-containing protein [Polyangium jinanense]
MDVISRCALRAWGFVWQSQDGRYAQTVVVKATFVLEPGRAPLAAEQEEPNEDDAHWNDDTARSLVAPSDKVPYKPRADVMLVGHAYAPGKQPVRSVMTRLVVGELDKSIEVWCDRGFRVQDGQLFEGPRFMKMPLRWERAAGGPETNNPAGVRFDAAPDGYGMVPIPNLQPPGVFVSKRSDTFPPVCYGPVAGTWPGRVERLGRLTGTFPHAGWERKPLPEGLDPSFFQAAPPDQQVTEIRPNERIILENLHPEHARLVTSLPGLRPKVSVERATGEREDVTLVADTLLIDTDRGTCVVVWRGRIGLRHVSEAGRLLVKLAEDGAEELEDEDLLQTIPPGAFEAADDKEREEIAAMTMMPSLSTAGPVMPFTGGGSQHRPASALQGARPGDPALPFGQGLAGIRGVEAPQIPSSVEETVVPQVAVVRPLERAPEAPARMSVGQLAVEARGGASHVWSATSAQVAAPAPPAIVGAAVTGDIARAGAAALSDAAARAEMVPADRQDHERRKGAAWATSHSMHEPVKLLWFDEKNLPRISKHPEWQVLLAEIELEKLEALAAEDEIPEEDEPPQEKGRRDISAILAGGRALEPSELERCFAHAVGPRGQFLPPLVLVAGELVLLFDELEALKATVTMASPSAAGDKKLRETLDAVSDVLKTPGLCSASGLTEGLGRQVEEAFAPSAQRQRLPSDWLSTGRTRLLLSGRHYQRRLLRGGGWVRGHIRLNGGSVVTTYLPDALANELPLLQTMQVRLIAELDGPQEMGESGKVALFAIAGGLVIRR